MGCEKGYTNKNDLTRQYGQLTIGSLCVAETICVHMYPDHMSRPSQFLFSVKDPLLHILWWKLLSLLGKHMMFLCTLNLAKPKPMWISLHFITKYQTKFHLFAINIKEKIF